MKPPLNILFMLLISSCAFIRTGDDKEHVSLNFSEDVAIRQYIDVKWTPINQLNPNESTLVSYYEESLGPSLEEALAAELSKRFNVQRSEDDSSWEHYLQIEMIDEDSSYSSVSLYQFSHMMSFGLVPKINFKRRYVIKSLFTYKGEIMCDFIMDDEIIRIDSYLLIPVGLFFNKSKVNRDLAKDFASEVQERFYRECIETV